MPLTLPHSVQEVLGEEAATDLMGWLEVILTERAVPRDEYREVLSRLDILERDVTEVKADIAELRHTVDVRFDQMHERFERLEARTDQRFDQMYNQMTAMYDRMLSMTRWTVGIIALFGTIFTILTAIAQFGTP